MNKLIHLTLLSTLIATSSVASEELVLKGDALFGDLSARQIGPAIMSGRITDLQGHPTNTRVIYAGTAGGGVWRSLNGGASFQPIFDKHAQSIGVIAVDPNAPDTRLWVGTGETWTRNSVGVGDGLYRSEDGGVNWLKVGFEHSERISSIEINPKNSKEMYVGVLGALWGDSQERGVYKSQDGGVTWNKILYIDESTGCSDLVMDPNNPSVLYAAMWEHRRTAWSFSSGGKNSALYKSTDAGKTWNKIHNGFPEGRLGRFAVAVAPSNSNRLYAVLETEKDQDKGLYRSDDAGKSWKHMNGDFGLVVRPFYFSRLVVDPNNPDVVTKGGLTGSISRDGGKTFKGMGPMHADIHDVWFDKTNSDRMYVATDGGVYRTWDGATTMEIVANIPVSQFYHVSVDDAVPYNIYGGLQDNGSWYGPSYSPGGIQARDWHSIGYGDGFRVLKHKTKPIIYSEMQGAENVWRYDSEKKLTKTIQPLPEKGDPKLRFNWNAPMALSEKKPDRLYMGSQFVHMSNDMGDTWTKISPDLTTNDPAKQNQQDSGGLSKDNSGAENHSTIFTIAESPLDEKIIWVGTDDGNVQVTRNAGKSWQNVTANIVGLPKNTWVYHIEASSHDKAVAYAVFDGHTKNDKNTYVYKTSDFGQSWQSIVTSDIYGFARALQEDYVNKDLLFLGTEFGLYVTVDGGKNWNQFTRNMPAAPVYYLEMHKGTSDLVLGTHGRGIIIVDDVSPLRQVNQTVLAKDVHFFDRKPTVISEEGAFAGASTEMEYVGPNPDRNAKIIYYLKNRHIFGKMSLDIYDKSGNKVAELAPGKAKGINVISWDYRLKPPKIAKAKTFAFGGFASPTVEAGEYKVVLTKGKETYESKVTLAYDPQSALNAKERKQLHAVTKTLYDMTQALAYEVYQIDEWLNYLSTKEDEKSKAMLSELTALKDSMVVTSGDNYVGASEPQLREKLADLFSKVVGAFNVPSSAELANQSLLTERFEKAKIDFNAMKARYGEAAGMPQLKSFEAFLNE